MTLSTPTTRQLPSARYTRGMERIMTIETKKFLNAAHAARRMHQIGAISYEEARATVKQYIDHANERARAIAKEFGVRYKPMSVTTFMR